MFVCGCVVVCVLCMFASIITISMQLMQINCAKFIHILRSTERYGAMCPRVHNERRRVSVSVRYCGFVCVRVCADVLYVSEWFLI